jgi:hypothetical protein
MRKALLTASLLTTALLSAACGPDETPDARFRLTFQGESSCANAGVDQIRLEIAGRSETASCSGGITLVVDDLLPGTYDALFQASDASGVRYSARQQITHTQEGTHSYVVDLKSITEQLAEWRFAPGRNDAGLTCEEADIAVLSFDFTGPVSRSFEVNCVNGGRQAASFADLEPGTYDILVEAFDPTGRVLYASEFRSIQIRRGANDPLLLDLLPAERGGLELTFVFDLGNTTTTNCATAGVDDIEIGLIGPTGTAFRYTGVDAWNCADGPIRFKWDVAGQSFEPGIYTLEFVNAYAPGGRTAIFSAPPNSEIYIPAGRDVGFDVTLQ